MNSRDEWYLINRLLTCFRNGVRCFALHRSVATHLIATCHLIISSVDILQREYYSFASSDFIKFSCNLSNPICSRQPAISLVFERNCNHSLGRGLEELRGWRRDKGDMQMSNKYSRMRIRYPNVLQYSDLWIFVIAIVLQVLEVP